MADYSAHLAATVKQLCPPFLLPWLKRVARHLHRRSVEWEYVADDWPTTAPETRVRGWNVEGVLQAYVESWPAFNRSLQAPYVLGLGSEDGPNPANLVDYHNTLLSYAYALACAARLRQSISLLDWGGGIGQYYWVSKALVPDLILDYHCRDLPLLADYGSRHFPELHFYSDDACFLRTYDLVLASGALHYAADWKLVFTSLARAATSYFFVTRLPIVFRSASHVFVQRAYKYGYGTEYLGWCLNRDELLQQAASLGLSLMREFMLGEAPDIVGAPEPCRYRGFLFSCKPNSETAASAGPTPSDI